MNRGTYREVDVAGGVELARSGYLVIDVREPEEWQEGHVAGATHLPLGEVAARIGEVVPDPSTPILLYCRSGARSGRAAAWLTQLGYSDVVNLNGFSAGWRDAGGDWEEPPGALTPDQQRRYARQVSLPEVGVDGQRRLLESSVLVVGAGGLGSPAALYLAAAGIGTIGVADRDVVDESNLHRQVLHTADRIGVAKAASAARTLEAANPGVRVRQHPGSVERGHARDLVASYDLVVDATDNLEARYALNDAAVETRTPLIHGSVHRWIGQVTTIVPHEGPCYRCLYPAQPPAELAPDCDVTGVLGVVPGTIGMLQAAEALKLLLGAGDPLIGRLLTVDLLAMRFDELTVERDPACPTCGSPDLMTGGVTATPAAAAG